MFMRSRPPELLQAKPGLNCGLASGPAGLPLRRPIESSERVKWRLDLEAQYKRLMKDFVSIEGLSRI